MTLVNRTMSVQRSAPLPLQVATVLLGFTVPISVVLDNVLLAVLLLTVLFNAQSIWQIVCDNPVARAAWLLFAILLLGVGYGATPLREAVEILGKYADLAFIPLFMLLLRNNSAPRWAQHAFLASMGMTLLLSYLVGFHWLPPQSWMNRDATPSSPAIFHSYITQSNMMSFATFLALLNLRSAVSLKLKLAWAIFVGLAVVNVLFMLSGRTGYLILLVLLCWFVGMTFARYAHKHGVSWGWREIIIMWVSILTLMVTVYHISPRLHARVSPVIAELQAWQPNRSDVSSTGVRLNFYYNALQIIYRHPFFGVGTGGFATEFMRQTEGKNVVKTHNPHNEYLMIGVQTGILGLVFLLYMFYTLWRCAARLDSPFGQDAARGLVLAYLVNCSLNSPLLDHSDGLFFAFMTAALYSGLKAEDMYG